MSRPQADRYARQVERWWQELRGTPVVLSPREWELVCDWYARGVPLQLVQEALQSAGDARGRRRGPPRTLAYVAPSVEEAWTVVLSGKLGHLPPSDAHRGHPARRAWESCRGREAEASDLGRLLDDLLQRLGAGATAEEIDEGLDERLPAVVPEGLLKAVREQLSVDLAPFRDRMAGDVFEATFRRAVVDRLRTRLALPRLARDSSDS